MLFDVSLAQYCIVYSFYLYYGYYINVGYHIAICIEKRSDAVISSAVSHYLFIIFWVFFSKWLGRPDIEDAIVWRT